MHWGSIRVWNINPGVEKNLITEFKCTLWKNGLIKFMGTPGFEPGLEGLEPTVLPAYMDK